MKPYTSYKDSGIAWIGQIPSHWEIKGLRSYLTMISEKGHGDKQLLSVTREQGVIVRNTDSKEENHNFIPDDLNGYKLVKKGQFAINKMKSWQGSYGVSEYEGIVSPAYFVCDLTFPYKPFFSMAIRSKAYIPFFTQCSKGIRVDQWDLSPLALKSIPFIEPPVDEQEAIVRYITEKSEKIDRYIAEQERLLAALDELRQAEIARAVTRGLNPDAPLRDSGIDWIGSIPAHWDVRKLKNIFTRFSNGTTETQLNDGTSPYPVTRIETISQGVINRDRVGYINEFDNISNYQLCEGDIVLSHINSYERIGNFAIVEKHDLPLYHGMNLLRLSPNQDTNVRYAHYFMRSCLFLGEMQRLCKPAINQVSVPASKIKNISIIYPPLDEQRAIVEYLDAKTAKIDRMKADIEKQIGLLKEYKQRMISDAVTGKIDVREALSQRSEL